MPEGFAEFFKTEPLWAVIITIFTVLPILGAVAWVIMRALKPRQEANPSNSEDSE